MDDDGILAIGGGERENNDQEVSKMFVKTNMQSLDMARLARNIAGVERERLV